MNLLELLAVGHLNLLKTQAAAERGYRLNLFVGTYKRKPDVLRWLKSEKAKIEAEVNHHRNLAGKLDAGLKSLSDAYNCLEQDNLRLESEMKILKEGGTASALHADLKEIKAEAREEALKESEAELNDLLVCFGQEQSKVEKLSSRLVELGEDVDLLVEGIGDDAVLPDDNDDDDDDEEEDDDEEK